MKKITFLLIIGFLFSISISCEDEKTDKEKLTFSDYDNIVFDNSLKFEKAENQYLVNKSQQNCANYKAAFYVCWDYLKLLNKTSNQLIAKKQEIDALNCSATNTNIFDYGLVYFRCTKRNAQNQIIGGPITIKVLKLSNVPNDYDQNYYLTDYINNNSPTCTTNFFGIATSGIVGTHQFIATNSLYTWSTYTITYANDGQCRTFSLN